jgi:dynein heavy chain, axonemal
MQLPEESKKFDAIDKSFKVIMAATSKNPNVVDACTADNRLAVLNGLSDRLDNCQKSLSDYLDTKRCSFPRFFFISDDELLSVLGNADPGSIQIHLLKLFDNVKEMQFGRNNKVMLYHNLIPLSMSLLLTLLGSLQYILRIRTKY